MEKQSAENGHGDGEDTTLVSAGTPDAGVGFAPDCASDCPIYGLQCPDCVYPPNGLEIAH